MTETDRKTDEPKTIFYQSWNMLIDRMRETDRKTERQKNQNQFFYQSWNGESKADEAVSWVERRSILHQD